MESFNSQYNIPEPDSIFAGSYVPLVFQILDINKLPINLLTIPKISFNLCKYGQYGIPIISFSNKDNTEFKHRITIENSNIMNIYLYPDDTLNLQNSYYDFQIIFESNDRNYTSVAGQGKIKICRKI